ncbi:MAG: hypothetical protein IT581_06845 [Verrucomicrobiales bacterium]|nr:hypothetical protein [Verrucomicrobiales bacterium]
MNDWNIQARARACQACERAFADKETFHTLLFEQRSGFERLDVCGGCWEEQHRHGATDRKGFVSHWQGMFAMPPAAPPEPIQRDNAESLLRRLTELNDPAWQPAAFILAVMLERKRILKTREQLRQGSKRTFIYELPRTGEVFSIPDPDLHLDQLATVQRDVAELLERGLPVAGAPTEEPFVPEMTPAEIAIAAGSGEPASSANAAP